MSNTTDPREYEIDGERMDFREFIRRAEKLGYKGEEDGALLTTSGAARVLRNEGHTVYFKPAR